MAEERLVDDDKDRKYKIRKNADGEDELVLKEEDDGDLQEPEELEFEVPELDSDDEEAAVMTPEQLAAREKMRLEEAEKRREKIGEIARSALRLLEEKRYDDAAYKLAEADGLGTDDGTVCALKLRALTRDFSDFSECGRGLDAVKELKALGGEDKLKDYVFALPEIEEKVGRLRGEIEELNAENELKKSERRAEFKSKRDKSLIFFAVTAAALIVFGALAIYFGTHLTAIKGGANIPLFITFISLAGAFFIAFIIAAKFLWKYAHNLKLNEKNSSSKLGRKLEESRARLEFTEGVAGILNDISR